MNYLQTESLECRQCGAPGNEKNLKSTTELRRISISVLGCDYCGTNTTYRIPNKTHSSNGGGLNIASGAYVSVGRDLVAGDKTVQGDDVTFINLL